MRGLLLAGFLIALLPAVVIQPYVGVLLYSWVSFMNPQRVVWGFAAGAHWALLIAMLTIVVWLCSREPKKPPADATYWLIVAFIIDISMTTLFALSTNHAVFHKWELTLKIFLFVLVTLTLTTDRIRVQALLWVMVIANGYYGFKGGIFTLLMGGEYHVFGPASSIISDNNQFAVALLVTVPLMNYLRVTSSRQIVRIGLAIAMVTSLIAVLGSYSRGALIALAATGVFFWLKSRRKVLPMLVLVGVGLVAVAVMPGKWAARMHTIQDYRQSPSAMGRIEIWHAALKIAEARPLTGGGFMSTYTQDIVSRYAPGVKARAVHSIYFETMAEQGFLGLVLWLAIAFTAWRNARWLIRSARDQPGWQWAGSLGRMAQVSLIAYFVGGAFLSMSYWGFYFTLAAMLAATRTMMKKAAEQPVAVPASLHYARAAGAALPAGTRVADRPAGSLSAMPNLAADRRS